MRILVVGPYPTMGGAVAAANLALVERLIEEGHDVEVASPLPGAAHHVADPGGARGALLLARLTGRFERVDMRIDATSLRVDADPRALLPARLALAAALRRPPIANVHLDRVPAVVSPKWASQVLGEVAEITVNSVEESGAVVAAGVPARKVVVAAASRAAPAAHTSLAPWRLSVEPSRTELQAAVRSRAAAARAEDGVESGGGRSASAILRRVDPLESAEPRSEKPGGAQIKRFLGRLTGWQVHPVVQHVNHLHQAMLDAVESLESTRDTSS